MSEIVTIHTDKTVLTLVRDFYSNIDAQQWDAQETFVSNEFIAILGSSIHLSFKPWQDKLKTFYEGFPDGRHFLNFYIVEGNRILSVGHFAGTHGGEFMGEQSSGIQIEMGVMHLDRVVDNKIIEHTAAADLLGLSRQLRSDKSL